MSKDPVADPSVAPVLSLLADETARRIVAATATEPRSVTELERTFGVPASTAYRKIDDLVEHRILTERLRIRQDGKHTREYELAPDSIRVQFDGGTIDIDIADEDTGPTGDSRSSGDSPASTITDGGKSTSPRDLGERRDRLESIFVSVTGTEAVTVEQEPDSPHIDFGEEVTVANYVTAQAKNDGLRDALADPDRNSSDE